MSDPSLASIAADGAATKQRVNDIFERLFEEGPDGGAIGAITKTLTMKADVKDFDKLKAKVDKLTWRAAWSSGAVTGIAFMVKYGWSELFRHH